MALEREKALDLALAQIEKQFGRGSIMKLGDAQSKMAVEVIPTGAIAIDIALGVGGVPRGRIIEIYGPESSGKCVTPDTLVFTENGMVPIGQLGDLDVEGFQPRTVRIYSEDGPAETSHFYNGGVKDTIRIQTACGFRLEGTPNHRVRALTRQGEYVWRRLDELAVGDRVAIQRGQGLFGKGADLSGFKHEHHPLDRSRKDFSSSTLTPELGRLLGYLVGDGTCTASHLNKNVLAVTVGEDEVADDIARLCLNIFREAPRVVRDKRRKSTRTLRVFNAAARAFLAHAGLGYWRAEEKEIPWAVLCSPREVVAEFLRGLFESDGSVYDSHIELASKSEKLARQVQVVLLNFGIVSRLRPKVVKGTEYFRLDITGQRDKAIFADEIGFASQRKQLRLVRYLSALRQYGTVGDSIPYLNETLELMVRRVARQVRPVMRADWRVVQDYIPCSGKRVASGDLIGLSYPRVARILTHFRDASHLPEYRKIQALAAKGVFWDVIEHSQTSRSHVVDLTVPGPAAFFGNGFINHNTTVALHVIAEAQKTGGTAAFIDAEHALDPVYAAKLGVDVENLLVSQPDTGEQALEIAEALVRSGAIDVIVVDSVAALVPRAEIEGEMGDSHVGLQARLMSQALRKLTGAISKSKTCAIFINQLREKVGVMFGNPETTPGGRALKFYASVRLEVRRVETLKQGNDMVGIRARVKVVKNKVAPPFKQAEVDIMYAEGISGEGSLIDVATEMNILQKSGAWYSYKDQRVGQGRDNVREFLKQNPEVAREIEGRIREALKMGAIQAKAAAAAEEAE